MVPDHSRPIFPPFSSFFSPLLCSPLISFQSCNKSISVNVQRNKSKSFDECYLPGSCPPHHCSMTHQPPWKHSATSKCTVWRFIWALEMQDVEDPELWETVAHVAAGRRWGPQCEPWLSLKIEVQPTSLDGGGSDLWVWAVVFSCDSCASPLLCVFPFVSENWFSGWILSKHQRLIEKTTVNCSWWRCTDSFMGRFSTLRDRLCVRSNMQPGS